MRQRCVKRRNKEAIRTFYERLLNPLRPGAALAPATLDKLKERALRFFTTARMLKIYI